jgi:hypothetical protein
MDLLYALFIGAGVAAFSYTRMGRRVGYGNTQNVIIVIGVIFVLATIFAYTVFKFVLNI